MAIDYGKRLPPGDWVKFSNISDFTTEEDVQMYLADAGIEVELDRIAIARGDHHTWVTISFTKETLRHLIDRACQRKELHGVEMVPFVPTRRGGDNRFSDGGR